MVTARTTTGAGSKRTTDSNASMPTTSSSASLNASSLHSKKDNVDPHVSQTEDVTSTDEDSILTTSTNGTGAVVASRSRYVVEPGDNLLGPSSNHSSQVDEMSMNPYDTTATKPAATTTKTVAPSTISNVAVSPLSPTSIGSSSMYYTDTDQQALLVTPETRKGEPSNRLLSSSGGESSIGSPSTGGEDTMSSPNVTSDGTRKPRTIGLGNEKAQSIRARLRDQEQRLSKLVSNRRTHIEDEALKEKTRYNEVTLAAMEDVKDTLRQVEAEKAELEQKLEYLKVRQAEEEAKRLEESQLLSARSAKHMENVKFSDEHDAFLRSKLAGIQKGFQEQNTKIQELQDIIKMKDSEIDILQLEIHNKLKTIIDLEYDITCHSIHYTEYSQQQYQLGNDAMNELNELVVLETRYQQQNNMPHSSVVDDAASSESPLTLPVVPEHIIQQQEQQLIRSAYVGGHSSDSTWMGSATGGYTQTTMGGERKSSLNPRRAKKLITKLLSDLDHLEELYKNEKLKSIEIQNSLQKENEELKVSLTLLENEKIQTQQEEYSKSSKRHHSSKRDGKKKTDMSENNMEQLRKRIAILEAVRFLYKNEIYKLRAELEVVKQSANAESSKHSMEIARLQLAYDAIKKRCSTLEIDILDNSDHDTTTGPSQRHGTIVSQSGHTSATTTIHDDGISALDDTSEYSSHINPHSKLPTIVYPTGYASKQQQYLSKSSYAGGTATTYTERQHYATIERRILECYNEIARLEADSEVKDLQITALKKEIYALRTTDIANGNGDPDLYSKLDMDILNSMDNKTHKLRSLIHTDEQISKEVALLSGCAGADYTDHSGNTADLTDSTLTNTNFEDDNILLGTTFDKAAAKVTMTSYITDLRKQLAEVREELTKKEQELIIEKAKSSCMAANLLDRIESLDKEVEEAEGEGGSENNDKVGADPDEDLEVTDDAIAGKTSGLDDPEGGDQTDPSNVAPKRGTSSSTKKKGGKKERKKIFGRIPLRFYL